MIAAVSKNLVIGKNNDLPWRLPNDMKYFMQKTKGHHVLMGRKNYDSIPAKFKPLPDRTNLVLTHQDLTFPGCVTIHDIQNGIQIARSAGETELFIIGGQDIYQLALPFADVLYLTEVDATVEGDRFFPQFDKSKYAETFRQRQNADEKHKYGFDFVTYERLSNV